MCFSSGGSCGEIRQGDDREYDAPLFDSAFVTVGLKLCGGDRRAARCAAPTGYPQGVFFRKGRTPAEPCSGRPQGSPLRGKTDRERWFGKLRRSCEIAAAAIFANPGPSGPEEIAETTPFLRAGNIAKPNRYASTVMGSGESGPMGTKCPSAASPVAFCPIPRYSRQSPAKRVCREEEEQGNERSFRRQAETEWSGLCDDEPPWAK